MKKEKMIITVRKEYKGKNRKWHISHGTYCTPSCINVPSSGKELEYIVDLEESKYERCLVLISVRNSEKEYDPDGMCGICKKLLMTRIKNGAIERIMKKCREYEDGLIKAGVKNEY